MGKGFKHGASGAKSDGDALNFTVQAYPSEVDLNVATPAENTIGVVTTNPITGWYFSATQPENMAEGEVWFSIGVASPCYFNALTKNTIMVYPSTAKQYVSSTLNAVVAKRYHEGVWTELWDGTLLAPNATYDEFTGGWVANTVYRHYSSDSSVTGKATTVIHNENSITITAPTAKTYGSYHTVNKVDISDFKSLCIDVVSATATNTEFDLFVIEATSGTLKTDSAGMTKILGGGVKNASGTYSVDISGLTGEYYIGIDHYNYDYKDLVAEIKKIYLVR